MGCEFQRTPNSGDSNRYTKRKQTELAIQQHARQQGLIAAFGQQALASACLDELWKQAATFVSDGLDVAFCKALQLAPDSRSFILKAGVGWDDGWMAGRYPRPMRTRRIVLYLQATAL